MAAASGEADGMAQPTPPRCQQDKSRKRAAVGEDGGLMSRDKREVELIERKVRLGARPKQKPHQRRGEALAAAGV